MKDALAERLLARVMKWTSTDVSRERGDLQALASYRYDEYQQFFPGMKFIESLALWLNQITDDGDKKIIYDFVKRHLIFVSSSEMTHLVTITYPDIIHPILIRMISKLKGIPEWHIRDILESPEYRALRRQSLFLGLSDGSHTDIFRRRNTELSNEQILRTHEISKQRALDMINDLSKDLTEILQRPPKPEEKKFRTVFLLDDFSGSGISYIRNDSGKPDFAGKLAKFYNDIHANNDELSALIDPENVQIYLVLYVSTSQARERLEKLGKERFGKIPFTVLVTHTLSNTAKLDGSTNSEILKILQKYFDDKIMTEHYLKGKHDNPHLGFDECGLPLILYHNTPNNSLPLLWFEDDRKFRGLFPRVSRHV